PAGTVTLNVTADPGIGAGRLAGLAGAGALPAGAGALPGPSALDTLFDGVVIGVDYIRSPGIE
ncbi:MAG: hypothetical protein N2422_12940, partial [Rhodobacteraceae bacterium]|nr:hypothetical protein [Paracoccaceae bacterium]